jgi:hypothetical protein
MCAVLLTMSSVLLTMCSVLLTMCSVLWPAEPAGHGAARGGCVAPHVRRDGGCGTWRRLSHLQPTGLLVVTQRFACLAGNASDFSSPAPIHLKWASSIEKKRVSDGYVNGLSGCVKCREAGWYVAHSDRGPCSFFSSMVLWFYHSIHALTEDLSYWIWKSIN